ncbi:hypothetical protein BDV34DRAFT_234679 [Aspergillus parasiticus]|uniref:Uncharacterized protein n=1 Tax=Aspergillus parasiticus TaxID=5067 RepID=A0A5N6DQ32_ASPPA|nr:hypothetical protein BDV34DRAFT_234679 [Aspergillus parasiticus]
MAISSIILSHEEKRIREFYRIVYLLSSLGLRRGDRIKREDRSDRGTSVEQKIISVPKHRRNVADALAYISAYDKTPARVTAVALGIEEGRLAVWIAANQEVKPEVEDFLTSVLSRLDQIAHGPESECDDLVDFVLRFNWKGVQKYYEKFGSEWASYYKPHQSSGHSVLRELDDWVQETCPKPGKILEPEDMVNLARKCYKDRKRNGGVFDMLNEASKQGIMSSKVSERLCNLLYKIGKHITLCLNLIDARKSLTEDFKHGAVVKPICVPARHLDRTERKYSFGSITTHIFPSEISLLATYVTSILPTIPDNGFGHLPIKSFTILGVSPNCEVRRTAKSSWLLQQKSSNANYEKILRTSGGRDRNLTIRLPGSHQFLILVQ